LEIELGAQCKILFCNLTLHLKENTNAMKLLIFPLIFLLLAACSGVRVLNAEANDGFELGNYKTFDFYQLEARGDTMAATFAANAERLKLAIAKELQEKGLKQSSANPALLVNIGVVVEEKIQTRETTLRDAPMYMGTRNYSWKSEDIEVGRYKEGTVTVHLVDPATKKLMWKGAVEGVLPAKSSKVPPMIDESMTTLFSKIQ
jgi:hypothetical protein